MDKDIFARRRKILLETMKEGVLFLMGAPEPAGLGGAGRFYQNRDLLYYAGLMEPGAAALFNPRHPKPFTLFVLPRDPAAEKWTGKRFGTEGAMESFGADQAFPVGQWAQRLYEALVGEKTLYYRWGVNDAADLAVLQVLQRLRREQRADRVPVRVVDSGEMTFPQRLVKSPEEINLLRGAAAIAKKAMDRTYGGTEPGMWEYQVQAVVEETYRLNGADGPSFPTISAAGAHGTCMHYAENSGRIEPGDFLLLDTGCSYREYACDITRTFVPRGRAGPEQKIIWDTVYAVQKKMIGMIKPGISLCELNQISQREIAQKCIDLGILKEGIDEVMEKNLHKEYYPHRLGHWIGLDVHDAGSWGMEDPNLPLAPGMALTVEPGIYVPEDCPDHCKKFAGIGVRLEEDVVVTEGGHEVITRDIPVLMQT